MKKKYVAFVLILVIAMTITACGKENRDEEKETVEYEFDTETELEEASTEIAEEETDNLDAEVPDESKESNSESEAATESTTDTPTNQKKEASEKTEQQKPTEQSKEQSKNQEEQKEQPKEQKEQSKPAEQSTPMATLNGRIASVGSGKFVIRKANAISSEVMVSEGEGAEQVSVVYTDSTEFVLCSTSDGGITANYSSTSSASLSSDRMVEIQGAYQGNDFVARKVTIYNFQ